MNLINSVINNMKNSSKDNSIKQRMFLDQNSEKKSYDIEIQNVKHEINWRRDFFTF